MPQGRPRVFGSQEVRGSRYVVTFISVSQFPTSNPTTLDNTNADPETRAHWTSLAKELNIPIRCVQFISTPDLCRHNNAVRASNKELVCIGNIHLTLSHSYSNQNPESRTSLPGIAFGDFGRRFRAPTLHEGFDDIIPVEFQFHGNEEAKSIWGQYWV